MVHWPWLLTAFIWGNIAGFTIHRYLYKSPFSTKENLRLLKNQLTLLSFIKEMRDNLLENQATARRLRYYQELLVEGLQTNSPSNITTAERMGETLEAWEADCDRLSLEASKPIILATLADPL